MTNDLAADASEHGRVAPVRIGRVGEVHAFVTDRRPNAAFTRPLAGVDARPIETVLASGRRAPGRSANAVGEARRFD